jgi:hypothetical protein
MRFPIFIISLLFPLIVASDDSPSNLSVQHLRGDDAIISPSDTDIERTCRRLRTLTKLNEIANNQTIPDIMNMPGNFVQERIDWIRRNSADITARLDELTSNSTLTAECETMDAQRDTARKCKTLRTLERLVNSTNGQIGLGERPATDFLADAQEQKLQQRFEKAQLKLQELKTNATLMRFCTGNAMLQQNGAIGSRKHPYAGAKWKMC